MNPYLIHANELLGGLATEMGGDCPTFLWLRANWKIIPGTAAFNKPLREGGFSHVYDLSFSVLVSQFAAVNLGNAEALQDRLQNTKFAYRGKGWKVQAVDIMAGGAQIKIAANSDKQNA